MRSLSGVDCSSHPPQVCELLLRAVAPHLEELELVDPQPQCLRALGTMPRLRKLSLVNLKRAGAELPLNLEELLVKGAGFGLIELMQQVENLARLRVLVVSQCGGAALQLAPALPLQLEELDLRTCSFEQLLSITRMPRLRRLALHCLICVNRFIFRPRPPRHCGLSWLQLVCQSDGFVLSLLRAHADTLREIQLVHSSYHVAVEPGCYYSIVPQLYCEGLPDCLRSTSFPNLQRLALLRRPKSDAYDPLHTAESCRLQVRKLQDALRPKNAAVSVVCDLCDEGVQL